MTAQQLAHLVMCAATSAKCMRGRALQQLLPLSVATSCSASPPGSRRQLSSATPSSALLAHIKAKIMVRGGPISISEYMQDCLTSPQGGFYMSRDVFGSSGDFVTSPEISQMFGEMVGIWCVHTWMAMGQPQRLQLVEMGPGRGTLMADLLRGTAAFHGFSSALEVHLVELSPALRAMQWRALQCRPDPEAQKQKAAASRDAADLKHLRSGVPQLVGQVDATGAAAAAAAGRPSAAGAGGDGSSAGGIVPSTSAARTAAPGTPEAGISGWNNCKVHWHPTLDSVPDGPAPALYIAHEFFDALPVHQFVRDPEGRRGWVEKLVDTEAEVEAEKEMEEEAEKGMVVDAERVSAEDVRKATGKGAGRVWKVTGKETGRDVGKDEGRRADVSSSSSSSHSNSSDVGASSNSATRSGAGREEAATPDATPAAAAAASGVQGSIPPSSARASEAPASGAAGRDKASVGPGPVNSTSGSGLRLVMSPGPTPASSMLVPLRLSALSKEEAEKTEAIEICAVGMATAERLAQRIGRHGGAALVVDYGRAGPPYSDSLMAIRAHRGVGVLDAPGTADLSAWVDFGALRQGALGPGGPVATSGPVRQSAFLRAMGIEARLQQLASRAKDATQAESLQAGVERLLDEGENGMGRAYQVMAIHHQDLKDLAGLS